MEKFELPLMEGDVMSRKEKEIMCQLVAPSPELPFKLVPLKVSQGPDTLVYEIPENMKFSILQKLFIITKCPQLDEEWYDLHENKKFRVGDFLVIREYDRNFLVSPYYPKSGGMLIDWLKHAPSYVEVSTEE